LGSDFKISMSKIIYIAGLGHSGTTLLDMSLGAAGGVTGLGELKTLMDDNTRQKHYTSVCSCGKKAGDCDIWGKIPNAINGLKTDPEKIEAVLRLLDEVEGKGTVLVDSSKNSYPYLSYMNQQHDLSLVFLTRDVRSWSYSRHLSTGKPVVYFMLRWFLENKKLLRRIRKMGIDPIFVGYEELALYPDHLLQLIAEHTGIPYSAKLLVPGNTTSHIISGNIARTDPAKRSGWKYDARWMLSRRILTWSPLLLFIQRMNRRLVYSKVNAGSILDFHLFGTRRKKELDRQYN